MRIDSSKLDITEIVSLISKSKEFIAIPFTIGDTVYFIKSAFSYAKEPMSEVVRKIEISDRENIVFRTNNNRVFTDKDINKIVFLSRESAQEAIDSFAWLSEGGVRSMNDKIVEIKEKIRLLQEELEPIDIQRKEILNKIIALDKELRQERLISGDYHPMSDLKNHKGEFIYSIELVFKDDKGELKTEDIYGDEFFRVDMSGHLDYSSQVGGILVYDDSEKSYSWWKKFKKTSYNFIGYLDAEFKDERDE